MSLAASVGLISFLVADAVLGGTPGVAAFCIGFAGVYALVGLSNLAKTQRPDGNSEHGVGGEQFGLDASDVAPDKASPPVARLGSSADEPPREEGRE